MNPERPLQLGEASPVLIAQLNADGGACRGCGYHVCSCDPLQASFRGLPFIVERPSEAPADERDKGLGFKDDLFPRAPAGREAGQCVVCRQDRCTQECEALGYSPLPPKQGPVFGVPRLSDADLSALVALPLPPVPEKAPTEVELFALRIGDWFKDRHVTPTPDDVWDYIHRHRVEYRAAGLEVPVGTFTVEINAINPRLVHVRFAATTWSMDNTGMTGITEFKP